MTQYARRADLEVALPIVEFAEQSLTEAGLAHDEFWDGVSGILHELGPRNTDLLAKRDALQAQIDEFHRKHPGTPDAATYRGFLTQIGYIVPEPAPFTVNTENVAPEIARLAGPQLVVPLLNARFALNAANARWGSLYDALYGTDAIAREGELAPGETYNELRGRAVITRGREFLDSAAPLAEGSHADATGYTVLDGAFVARLGAGQEARLADPAQFVGFQGSAAAPSAMLLRQHGLGIEINIDRSGSIGQRDLAGVQDIVLESALTTIMDLEDSVAAVDAEDKALGYRNWRGLMSGTLTESITKNGRVSTRAMHTDRQYTTPTGAQTTVPGRAVLLVRNVGHLMRGDSILDREGNETYEGIVDAIMTALGSLPDLTGSHRGGNSRTPSMYIVKPKMHGPEEVAFTVELFGRVESLLGLPERTLKVGIMDEERRTSVNLAACIHAARDRIVFINTGFLDRTGDEIHTSLQAGPMPPKAEIRALPWLSSYEDRNVAIGVACGLSNRAQIGKGMWAMPDLMHDMLAQKIAHVRSGASTAWVPSPTAATLHALHYHSVDAFAARASLPPLPEHSLADLLQIPLGRAGDLDPQTVATELNTNVQSILGYVVRWVDQGIGCSKVPDIHGVALMEDRATLRISSQLLANWLAHDVITIAQVDESLSRLARVVDEQNAGDPSYETLTPGTVAFAAARALIVDGARQPNGYTEPLLHALRRRKKAGER
ncbi:MULTISPECIES: malate synthase G [unclassified Leucobacter]|uniref:malate synthase G n=1 Tax=unclassified Leucobacter TaxID=2621730 RepID=UPI00165E1D8C|nr:malate synthase G [Leucobacter sp. cx-87]